ncbi:hypothetical protein JAAARDRAFT_35124 [Jaapia argillacea MUCL 33604]|uniref:Protein kinase domain-containing protein n=1 Tax=Jaapia argillacea MUCL 33604 TaxID=933084 RepID=A0A067PRK0_9AGAM|nr:hypothetical protein JAAARDRAFT_35124 [Jaapia argillacea MUCL 33604]
MPTATQLPQYPATDHQADDPFTMAKMGIKRVTLTSKKNWWMVELDDDDDHNASAGSFSSDETVVALEQFPPDDVHRSPPHHRPGHHYHHQHTHGHEHHYPSYSTEVTPEQSPTLPSVFQPPRHPSSIFSFPTPSTYSAPPNPLSNFSPFANGSASELFKCVVKKPDVVQMEINGEMSSNASDVTTQFLAELRVYTTVTRHRNIVAFLGCIENLGMVLEFVEGRTLYDVIREQPPLTRYQKLDYHNQLLDGLTHLHSFGLSHGDLSLLNIQVTHAYDTVKLLDFGRSVSAESEYTSPDEHLDPFEYLARTPSQRHTFPKLNRKVEQIHPGTRPFSAPEILRGECQDARLADAYGFGMILVCLDRCTLVDMKPWEQRKDMIPATLFQGCEVFEERARAYLQRWDKRKRLDKADMINLPPKLVF